MKQSILLTLSLLAHTVFAQENTSYCGTDELHQQIFNEHPEYNEGIIRAHNELQSYSDEYLSEPREKSGSPYIIPVVFHIIHDNGPENIDDSQVLDAIKQVNLQYRMLNADTNEIIPEFKNIAADTEIEIRLAQIDPNGNCTSGITRTVSTLTHTGNNDVKSLIQWPPDKYLNIYVCKQAAGLAGHALLPAAADTIPEWDGIVMQHSYVGTVGTSEYFRRTVLSHEIGHYLNLQHIWGGNNVPDFYYLPVAESGNCSFDDDVLDTPETIGWQTCNLGGTSCGTLDNVQNYMDYSYCARMFTQGQKNRMHACLNSSVANRNNLWSPSNLAATGTDDLTQQLCTVAFEIDKLTICAGESINLTDVSRHGVTNRNWTFSGGTPSSLTDSLVSVVYNTPGTYSISLSVNNGTQTIDTTLVDVIRVLKTTGSNNSLVESFENENSFSNNWAILNNFQSPNWELNPSIGYNSQSSIYIDNYNSGINTDYTFISEPIDASGLSDIAISFDFAYSKASSGNIETLKVAVSKDCGNTWINRKVLSGLNTLITHDSILSHPFSPNQNDWKTEIISNIQSSFLTDNLMVRFVFEALGENNIYIDNIQIAHPDILKVNKNLNEIIELYPNPTTSSLQLQVAESLKVKSIKFIQVNGAEVKLNYIKNSNGWRIDTKDLSPGIYYIQVESNNSISTKKFIKN